MVGFYDVRVACLTTISLLVLTAVAAPAFGSAARAVTPATGGLGKIILGMNAGPGTAQNFSLSHGVQYYRLGISFSTSTIRAINTQARTVGVDYLGIIDSNSLGVVRGGAAFHKTCISNCHWTLADWNSTVRAALVDYPTIHEWELWNEPYSPTQHSGYLTNASRYYSMVKSAYSIIKANNRNDTVVCLGGSAVGETAALAFSKAFWAYGASSYCNAVSLHAYVSGTALFNTSKYEAAEWPKNLGQYENLTGKPIWITEYGRESHQANTKVAYSQQNQNDFISQATGIFTNLSFVKRAYVYDLSGLSNPPSNTDFGLLNATTLKPKLAWFTFTSLYGKSLSHASVPTVVEKAPGLAIAHLTIAKLLQDKVTVSAPSSVDPVQLLVDGTRKASGNGTLTYNFVGKLLQKYTITAVDEYTGLSTTKTITVV